MKTQTTLKAANNFFIPVKKIASPIITITMVIFFLSPFIIKAQDNSTTANSVFNMVGLKPSVILTGSGLGASYSLQAYRQKNAYTFFAGPLFQFRKNNFSGVQAGIEYTLVGKAKKNYNEWMDGSYATNIELFVFTNSIFQNSATLNKTAAFLEQRSALESKTSFPEIKLRTVELYAGFGLRVSITNNLKWSFSAGIGGYSYLKNNYDLYHDKFGVGLIVRTGISWDFTAFNKKTKTSNHK